MSKNISGLFVEEEAMRCLLCYDAPCSKVCPAETNPAKFIRSLRFKNEDGAINTIRKNNAFGASCSELCDSKKYCEKACVRNKIDSPINIKYIQKYLMSNEKAERKEIDKKEVIGKAYIIGGDIKGLAAAVEFAKENYKVVVFTEKKVEEYLEADITDEIKKMLEKDMLNVLNNGVEIVKGIPSLNSLEEESFDVLLLASDDVQNINFFNKKFNSKVYYLNKIMRGPKDFVYMIKKGRESARKIIEEIRGDLYEQIEN